MDASQVQELFRRAVTSDDAAADANRCARCRAFPAPAPAITLRKVTGGRHVWIAEADIDYGGDQTQAVIIFELDDQGLIARETRYYPQRLQAPAWRAGLAEAMDARGQ